MIFQAFREFGYPTLYPPTKPFYCDTFLITFFYFSGSLVFSFLIILPGVRGKQRIFTFLYGSLSFLTGMLIIICNYSLSWETAMITTKTTIKTTSARSVPCHIGVYVGLRGFNVTLTTLDSNATTNDHGLHLNEAFRWTWQQGQQDSNSPLAGRLVTDYAKAQAKGSALPIVWVAQHFVMDAEKIRWGRHYRLAGYYTHILMWLAFPFWLLGNVLIYICIKYAGYFWISTGVSLIGANCLYYFIRCPVPLYITFPDATLKFNFGTSFWLTLYIGLLSIAIGSAIVVADARCYQGLMAFFGIDVLQEYEDYIMDPLELGLNKMTSPVPCIIKQSTKIFNGANVESGLVDLPKSTGTKDKNHNNNNSNDNLNSAGKSQDMKDSSTSEGPSDEPDLTSGFIVSDEMAFISCSNQISLLRKRGTSHSFLQKRKFSTKKPHLIISKSVPLNVTSNSKTIEKAFTDPIMKLRASLSKSARKQSKFNVKQNNPIQLKTFL